MFFTTHANGENEYISALGSPFEKSWNWIELSVNVPLYFASGDFNDDGFVFRRTFIFGHRRDLLEFLQTAGYSNFEVSLLSPDYLNGSDSYQLDVLKEIWDEPNSNAELYIFKDGKTFINATEGEEVDLKAFRKVMSF